MSACPAKLVSQRAGAVMGATPDETGYLQGYLDGWFESPAVIAFHDLRHLLLHVLDILRFLQRLRTQILRANEVCAP